MRFVCVCCMLCVDLLQRGAHAAMSMEVARDLVSHGVMLNPRFSLCCLRRLLGR